MYVRILVFLKSLNPAFVKCLNSLKNYACSIDFLMSENYLYFLGDEEKKTIVAAAHSYFGHRNR